MNQGDFKKLFLILIAALFLSACVAETIERRKPRRGPIQEVGFIDLGGGRVRYSAEGWPWIVASRRRTALTLMKKNCGRDLKVQITDEFMRTDADAPYIGQDINSSMNVGGDHYVIEKYVHLSYECQSLTSTAADSSTQTYKNPAMIIPESTVISTSTKP